MTRSRISSVVLAILLALSLTVFMFPLGWLLSTSLKAKQFTISIPPQWIPNPVSIQSYLNVFSQMPFATYLANSLIVGLGTTLLSVVVGSLAAYGFSRYPFASSRVLLLGLLAGQMFPGVMLVIPFYILLRRVGLLDTRLSLVIANTSLALPFAVYMLKGFFDEVPRELEEAAFLDGCGRLQAFAIIALPLISPGLAASALMALAVAWDDYVFALTFISTDSKRTLAVGVVESFVGQFTVKWGELMAASILMALPVILAFVFLQRYLVQGLTAGAVKG